MRVSSLLPPSHCEERERDEAILPRSKTRSPRFARDDGVTKEKARTFPSGLPQAALLFYCDLVFVFDFVRSDHVVRLAPTGLHDLVFLRVGEEGRRSARASVELSQSRRLNLRTQDGEIRRRGIGIGIERTAYFGARATPAGGIADLGGGNLRRAALAAFETQPRPLGDSAKRIFRRRYHFHRDAENGEAATRQRAIRYAFDAHAVALDLYLSRDQSAVGGGTFCLDFNAIEEVGGCAALVRGRTGCRDLLAAYVELRTGNETVNHALDFRLNQVAGQATAVTIVIALERLGERQGIAVPGSFRFYTIAIRGQRRGCPIDVYTPDGERRVDHRGETFQFELAVDGRLVFDQRCEDVTGGIAEPADFNRGAIGKRRQTDGSSRLGSVKFKAGRVIDQDRLIKDGEAESCDADVRGRTKDTIRTADGCRGEVATGILASRDDNNRAHRQSTGLFGGNAIIARTLIDGAVVVGYRCAHAAIGDAVDRDATNRRNGADRTGATDATTNNPSAAPSATTAPSAPGEY